MANVVNIVSRKHLGLLCTVALLLSGTRGGALFAQDQYVLENVAMRLTFHRTTGLFDVLSVSTGSLGLRGAGPALQRDGQTVSAENLTRIETRRESFEDPIGKGEKLVVQYYFRAPDFGFRYELSVYRDEPWMSVTAYVPRGSYRLGDFFIVQGKLQVREAFKTRLYVSSGEAGGNTGAWELGMQRWESAAMSVYYEPRLQDAMGMGFYSFYRASSSVVSQYTGSNQIGVRAIAHYNDYQPQQEELRTESLLISFGKDPLRLLETWADAAVKVVRPKFNPDTRTGLLNTWYMYGDEISEQDCLKQAELLRNSPLPAYGVTIADTGEWQLQRHEFGDGGDALGYGEDREDPRLYPHGVKWLSERLHAMGFQTTFGANYAYAAPESSISKKNEPWIVREDRTRLEFGYPIDFTHPGAQEWLRHIARKTGEYKAVEWWTDFDGGPRRGKLHEPNKIRGFEDIREGLRVTRDTVGPAVLIHRYCCGPYFTYLGLADGVRTGNDTAAVGDWGGLKEISRQLAATYMLHQRFWINDPDPVYVGGRDFVHNYGTGPIGDDPSIRNEVRMRLQLHVLTGGFPTIGESLEDIDAGRMRLLTLVLPSYGQAARPLDLFVHTTPEVYDLAVKTYWDSWHVLFLQNWNEWDKSYDIEFSELGLDEKRTYAVFSFWDQAFLGEFRQSVGLRVGARKGEAYSIREVRATPWVLGTDLHLTQGGVELERVRHDTRAGQLSGLARRHAGAQGHVVAWMPSGYKLRSATGSYSVDPQPSGAAVVHLELNFEGETIPWSLTFEKSD